MRARLSDETVAKARELRATGMSYTQIARELGTSDNGIRKYCMDVCVPAFPLGEVHCPDCGELLPPQAKYCYMCGTRIYTEKEKLIRSLERMRGIVMLLPETSRDTTLTTINNTIKYLESLEV